MGQHRVDLAGVGDEVGVAGRRILPGRLGEEALEIAEIAIDGRAELRLLLILAPDLVEGLLALQRVEPPREDVLLATAMTLPELGCGARIDGPRDVGRQIAERFLRAVRPAVRGAALAGDRDRIGRT